MLHNRSVEKKSIAYPSQSWANDAYILMLIIRKLIDFLVSLDTEHQSDGQHVEQKRRASVANERQRNAGDRHKPDHHADVLEDLEDEHGDDPYDDE